MSRTHCSPPNASVLSPSAVSTDALEVGRPPLAGEHRLPTPGGPAPTMAAFYRRLFAPVDIASLVHFRIAFGVIMLWEVLRYFNHGWIGRYYLEPIFHFTYYGFDWVRPWPGVGMYAHFAALGALAACIALGLQYRLAATLFFLGFGYVFLLEQARYLNHFYLICLISFLMIFVPAHRAGSSIGSDTAPAWALWLLRAQVGIVYFYGGVAKLNEDWLRGEPLRTWLADHPDWPTVGALLATDQAAYLFSYGGLLFDLLVVPFLLWPRTRIYAFVGVVIFNVLNAWLFSIGIFPWFMIAASLLFFPPDWPRRLVDAIAPHADHAEAATARQRPPSPRPSGSALYPEWTAGRRITVGLLGLYLGLQLLVPLRHHLYPGEVSWTEEGHVFSWHMKLRDKAADVRFFATDPIANRTWEIDANAYLTPWQLGKMSGRPDMILQFSHFLADELRHESQGNIEIRAQVLASLNDRPARWLVDPTVDLAAQPRDLLPASWIMPLDGSPRLATR